MGSHRVEYVSMPPMTAAMAKQANITRHRLFSDAYQQLFRGIFIARDEPISLATWVEAAHLILPDDAVVTGLTALQLRGLDLGQPLPLRFAVDRPYKTTRPGLQVCQRTNLRARNGIVPNIDAVAEVCRSSDLLEAVVLVDRALHLKLITPDELAAAGRRCGGAVRRVCELSRPGAESVRETKLRLCMVAAGLPEPQLQVELYDDDGWIGRFDMYIEALRLIIEYDGDQHRTDRQQWTHDIVRLDRARKAGNNVVQVTAELFSNPWSQVVRIHDELVRLGYRGAKPTQTALWGELFGRPGRPSRR